MTDSETLDTLTRLLRTIPGVEAANFFRNTSGKYLGARIRCLDIGAMDVLAWCGMASNTQITIAEIKSRLCCEGQELRGIPCDVRFSDSHDDFPTQSQIFGFFVAKSLYSRGLVDDEVLDLLEEHWPVHFCRPK